MIADPVDLKLLSMDEVCERFTPLVWKLALKTRGPADIEDRVQEAYLALIGAYRWYEPGRGTKFLSIAFRIIQQDLWKLHNDRSWSIRRPTGNRSRRPGVVSMSMPVDAEGTELGSLLPDRHQHDEAMRNLESDEVQHAMGGLPARDAFVLREHFVHDRTMADIGKDLDVCAARVQQLSKRGIARLTVELARRRHLDDPRHAELSALVDQMERADARDRRRCELAVIEVMQRDGLTSYGGWTVYDFVRATIVQRHREAALAWMRRHGRRNVGNAVELGSWMAAIGCRPPRGLFNTVRVLGLRRV